MDSTLLAGLIGGACTMGAPIVTLLIKKQLDQQDLPRVSAERRSAIAGTWTGTVHQDSEENRPEASFRITMQLTIKGKLIIGRGDFDNENRHISVTCRGGFLEASYIKIDYRDKNPEVVRYGTAVGNLSAEANRLTGKFLGYGTITEGLVTGHFELHKGSV